MAAWMVSVKISMDKRANKLTGNVSSENLVKMFNMGTDLTKPFEYLLATGNLTSKTGRTILGIYTVVGNMFPGSRLKR